jgi:hypothetical protein
MSKDNKAAKAEFTTWRFNNFTEVYKILPSNRFKMFVGALDTSLVDLPDIGNPNEAYVGTALFSLYDDGWRLSNMKS